MNAKVKRWLPLGIVWVAAIVSGVIVVAGRNDDSSATAATGAPTSTPQSRLAPNGSTPPRLGGGSDTFEELAECLTEHGVELSPGSGRPNLDDSDVRAAFEACAQYLPGRRDEGRGFRFGPPGGFDGTPPDAPSQDGGSGSGSDV